MHACLFVCVFTYESVYIIYIYVFACMSYAHIVVSSQGEEDDSPAPADYEQLLPSLSQHAERPRGWSQRGSGHQCLSQASGHHAGEP